MTPSLGERVPDLTFLKPSGETITLAEFLGKGDLATARFIYFRTLFIQSAVAAVATLGATAWVMHDAPPGYRLASLLLVLVVRPQGLTSRGAQA